MKLEDYEKYYQSVGFYVIPTEVFKELFNELEAWKEQAKRKEEMIRLDQTKKVFDIIANIIKEGSCSYRHLIYDELGFYGVNYEELLSGMAITNAICDLEDLKVQHEEDLNEIEKLTSLWKTKSEENKKLNEEIKAVNKGLRKVRERAFKSKCKSLDLQKENQKLKDENFNLREEMTTKNRAIEDKNFINFYDMSTYEQLAFKSIGELANVSKIDLLNIIEFLQKDRRQWIEQFTKTHNESVDMQEENQELKKQLEPDYYVKGLEGTLKEYQQEMNKVTIQQKEFIKYLKEKIEELLIDYSNYVYDDYSEEKGKYDTCIEILQKYKEIVGGKE